MSPSHQVFCFYLKPHKKNKISQFPCTISTINKTCRLHTWLQVQTGQCRQPGPAPPSPAPKNKRHPWRKPKFICKLRSARGKERTAPRTMYRDSWGEAATPHLHQTSNRNTRNTTGLGMDTGRRQRENPNGKPGDQQL